MDKYILKYLSFNRINTIADVRKVQWPEFNRINLGKTIITKEGIN